MNKILNKITEKVQSDWKKYSEKKDEKAILDIIENFNIQIDDKRLNDYDIKLDPKTLNLQIFDPQCQTLYESTIKEFREDMRNGIVYDITISSPQTDKNIKQIKRSYFIDSKEITNMPIVSNAVLTKEELILPNDEFQINYKKEIGGIPLDKTIDTSITYSALKEGKNYPLFKHSVTKHAWTPYSTKQFMTYPDNDSSIKIEDKEEEIVTNNDNLIYTIKMSSDNELNLRGICFYNSYLPYYEVKSYVPFGFNLEFFPELFASGVTSSLMFDGISPDSYYDSLIITKDKDKILAEYLKTVESDQIEDEKPDEKSLYNEYHTVEIPSSSKGAITEDEITLLKEKMLLCWPDPFITAVNKKLDKFQNLIENYKGNTTQIYPFMLDYLLLSPLDMAIECLEKDKELYFKMMDNELAKHTLTKDKNKNLELTFKNNS